MDRTLVIDGVDAATFARLESAARERGLEVAAFARALLEQCVAGGEAISHDLDGLASTWSEEAGKAFDAETARMRPVEPEAWR